jgi:hypothetical protein
MAASSPVITQQYSSAIFVSLCCHSREEKFSVGLQYITISFLLLFV